GYANGYFVVPTIIYGITEGKLVDLGLQNAYSLQVPILVDIDLARGRSGMVGEGKNIWPILMIFDYRALISDLFVALCDAIIVNPDKVGHGCEGMYFGENSENTLYEVSKAIGQALGDAGKCEDAEPAALTEGEIDNISGYGNEYMGSESRYRGNRSRLIGWRPIHTTTISAAPTCKPISF
ncbi:hypothetical protein BDZ94DRAFT_1151772, partial [Collybia nuda]